MDSHGVAAETTIASSVVEALHGDPAAQSTSLMPDLVLRCDAAGVSAPDVLRRVLDRVTCENNDH